MAAVFDSLDFVKAAQENGFTQQQAEFQAHEWSKWINHELVTRDYLDQKTQEIIDRLTIRLGGFMIGCSALIIASLGLILKH